MGKLKVRALPGGPQEKKTAVDVMNDWGAWFTALNFHMAKFVGPDGLIRPLDLSAEMADQILRKNLNLAGSDEDIRAATDLLAAMGPMTEIKE